MTDDSIGLRGLNAILEWHRENGPKTIECRKLEYPEDPIKSFEIAYSIEDVHLPVKMVAGHVSGLTVHANALPLISGCLSGFDKQDLARLAAGHGIWFDKFIQAFDQSSSIQQIHTSSTMTGTEVFQRCFEALQLVCHEQIRDHYGKLSKYDTFYMMAVCTATSPQLWPKTFISKYTRENEGAGKAAGVDLNVGVHNFIEEIKQDLHLPRDASGPRYDWFLDRSGMLLPAVTTKSLGCFSLWEDLVFQSCKAGDTLHKLLDFCINNPPESLRPGILNGLQSMSLDASENITDGKGMFKFLERKLHGTWLEPVLYSTSLKLNLYCLSLADHVSDKEYLLQAIFNAMLEKLPVDLGYADFSSIFKALSLEPGQRFDEDFNREYVLTHLLKGLQSFLGNEVVASEDLDEMREMSISSCRRAIRLFSVDYQFDYPQFKDMPSSGIRLLIDEGLDMRQLPKMSSSARGRLLEDVLGM